MPSINTVLGRSENWGCENRNKTKKILKLLNLKQCLNEYLLESMNENKEIIEYFNNFFDFTTFEIIEYKEDQFYEYLTFDLSAKTTENIFSYVHNKRDDEYKLIKKPAILTAKTNNITISREILEKIFNTARENQIFLEAEKVLTKKINKN